MVYFVNLNAVESPSFTLFTVTGHLGRSQPPAVKDGAALDFVPGFGGHLHGFLLDIYLEMELIA